MREAHPQPLAFPAAPVAAGHVVGGPGLVDEDEAFGFEIDLTVKPVPRCLRTTGRSCSTVCPVFLRVIP
jgi:hypothetical protein